MAEKIKMYEIDGYHIRFNCCDNTLAILYNESDSLSEPKACPFCGMNFVDALNITVDIDGDNRCQLTEIISDYFGVDPMYYGIESAYFADHLINNGVTIIQNPRPLEEWGEDYGDVLWWKFPIEEPPYVGSPLSADWPGYHTHWLPIPVPKTPKEFIDD